MSRHLFSAMVLSALCLVFSSGPSCAGTPQIITLKDRSIIRGEVLAMKNGIYYVKSPTLGELKISADTIMSITADGAAAVGEEPTAGRIPEAPAIREGDGKRMPHGKNAAAQKNSQPQEKNAEAKKMNTLQKDANGRVQSMMMNGNTGEKIMKLGDNQSLQGVMSDPEVMNAIQNNDYEFLMNSDKMKELMESSDIKDLLGDVKE
ncbi:MAG: hypothetical protein HQM09_18120 [Candidatus Riflebacteria bacterium]|nr:hypothetical protein [Candidatus Riflebacteria bacterium]